MKTSELINKLVYSLANNGDLPTNIQSFGWYTESEGGFFKKVILEETDNSEFERIDNNEENLESKGE